MWRALVARRRVHTHCLCISNCRTFGKLRGEKVPGAMSGASGCSVPTDPASCRQGPCPGVPSAVSNGPRNLSARSCLRDQRERAGLIRRPRRNKLSPDCPLATRHPQWIAAKRLMRPTRILSVLKKRIRDSLKIESGVTCSDGGASKHRRRTSVGVAAASRRRRQEARLCTA